MRSVIATALAVAFATAPASAFDVPDDYQVLPPITQGTAPEAGAVAARLARPWQQPALGQNKSVAVADAFAGDVVWGERPEQGLIPASTTKLLTALTVMNALGPEHRFTTSVTVDDRTVTLVGGGDPQLDSGRTGTRVNSNGSLRRLARTTADALTERGVSSVRLRFDDSLFTGPIVAPFWGPDFLSLGVVAPITALSVDGGRSNPPASPRASDPAATAAQVFANALTDRGITVRAQVRPGRQKGERIAEEPSAPLADLVEHMLLTSDNTAAEILAHQAGLAVVGEGSFAGGVRATRQTLSELGISTSGLVLRDGSGLSRSNRISARQLVAVLSAAVDDESGTLWPVFTGLPVAGFDGSLAARFRTGPARTGRGAVTGKTGTLTGVSSLAGLAVDRDQELLMYAVITNDVESTFAASTAVDVVAARLARCGCG